MTEKMQYQRWLDFPLEDPALKEPEDDPEMMGDAEDIMEMTDGAAGDERKTVRPAKKK